MEQRRSVAASISRRIAAPYASFGQLNGSGKHEIFKLAKH